MKASSARASEIQNTLADAITDPPAKAALAKVLDTRKDYTEARARVPGKGRRQSRCRQGYF